MLRRRYDWTLLLAVLSLTQAMRTVAFQKTVESVPFLTANTSMWPSLSLYSRHLWGKRGKQGAVIKKLKKEI